MSSNPQSLFFACPDTSPAHKVHALKWTAREKSPLPPVICVHGLTRNAYDFVDIAARLAAKRDVFAFSMAGRGESDWLDNADYYNYPHYVNDCLHILGHELNLQTVDWLGTSMGGLIGMMVAASAGPVATASPEAVAEASQDKNAGPVALQSPGALQKKNIIRKLILNDIGPFLPLSAIRRIALYASRVVNFPTLADAERHCRAIYADFGIKGDAAWKFFTEKSLRPLPGGGFTLHYDPAIAKVFAGVNTDVDAWPIYEAVACPTLLLRGAHSDVLSEENAHAMTQRGPKAQLITFADCGHAPALQNAEQMDAVEVFLS